MAEYREVELALVDDPQIATRAEIDEESLADLMADIKRNGLLQPPNIKVTGERYEVVAGHRRTLAMRRLGWVKSIFRVLADDDAPPEAIKLAENLQRVDNNHAELAVYIGELVDKHGYNMQQLMDATRMKEAWINEHYALLQGDARVLQALHEGRINFSQAKVLNKCPDEVARMEGLYYAAEDHLPAERLKQWLITRVAASGAVAAAQAMPAPVEGEVAPPSAGIICEWCKQSHDPHQMLNFWMHRWEFELVMQFRAKYMEQSQG